MGLRDEVFEFAAGLPSLDDIKSRLGDEADAISFDGTLEVTPEDEAAARSTGRSPTSTLERMNHVTCRYRSELANKRRGITYVTISASLDGDAMSLIGNNSRLMDKLVEALVACGGKRKGTPAKRGRGRR